MIATCDAGGYACGVMEGYANARLIAAAPDLLAACQASLDWFVLCPTDDARRIAQEKLEAAIAKAKAKGAK